LRELAEDLGHLRERPKQLQRTAESALRIRMQLPLLANRQAERLSTDIPHDKRIFRDRREAGRLLAERLAGYRDQNLIVLALPRGGVVVGYEVARALGAPLDVVVARKLGAPWQPELAVGAIAPRGVRVLNEDVLAWLDISEDEVEQIASLEASEMERRMHLFRGDRPEPMLKGKTVILVDDGIATGMTIRAAIEYIGQHEPGHLVLAVPVCAPALQRCSAPRSTTWLASRHPSSCWPSATGTRTSSRCLMRRSWSCSSVLVLLSAEPEESDN
jgi:putative phosphoribosyl transferase